MQPAYTEPRLGGFRRLSGLPADSINGLHAALASLELRKHLADGVVSLYGGGTIEFGNAWQARDDVLHDLIFGASVFLAADLPLGPLNVGVGFAEGGEVTGFLYLGPPL